MQLLVTLFIFPHYFPMSALLAYTIRWCSYQKQRITDKMNADVAKNSALHLFIVQ